MPRRPPMMRPMRSTSALPASRWYGGQLGERAAAADARIGMTDAEPADLARSAIVVRRETRIVRNRLAEPADAQPTLSQRATVSASSASGAPS